MLYIYLCALVMLIAYFHMNASNSYSCNSDYSYESNFHSFVCVIVIPNRRIKQNNPKFNINNYFSYKLCCQCELILCIFLTNTAIENIRWKQQYEILSNDDCILLRFYVVLSKCCKMFYY